MTTVELAPAYMWDCPECGRENFQRAVSVVLDPADEADADVIRAMYGLDDGEALPPGVRASARTRPERVTCKHCVAEFKAVDSGAEDDDAEG